MRSLLLATVIPFLLSLGLVTPIAAQSSSSSAQQGGDVGANGVYKIGGDVSAPVLIRSVEPEYPEKALSGNVTWQNILLTAQVASSVASAVFIAAHY